MTLNLVLSSHMINILSVKVIEWRCFEETYYVLFPKSVHSMQYYIAE